MKKRLLRLTVISVISIALTGIAFADQPTTENQKASYTIGYDMGYNYNLAHTKIDPDMLLAGLKDGLNNTKSQLTSAEMKQALQYLAAENAKAVREHAAANLQASDAYLVKVSGEKNVHKIQNGLYYKALEKGHGATPSATDLVTIKYQGSLANGTVFYDTFAVNKTETFSLSHVILGWRKAIQKMSVGSTWMIYMAPSLGYGLYAPVTIGPNQALTYKITLVAVHPATK